MAHLQCSGLPVLCLALPASPPHLKIMPSMLCTCKKVQHWHQEQHLEMHRVSRWQQGLHLESGWVGVVGVNVDVGVGVGLSGFHRPLNDRNVGWDAWASLEVLKEIVQALMFLHEHQIIHGDLKVSRFAAHSVRFRTPEYTCAHVCGSAVSPCGAQRHLWSHCAPVEEPHAGM
eukprot:1157843-Pelagomonas_calceolata.AAC.10